MTLATWKEEFYPVAANQATTTELEAAKHSLRKWEGLRPENLMKHGCKLEYADVWQTVMKVTDDTQDALDINYETCALCNRHDDATSCGDCILATVRDGTDCDHRLSNEDKSPFRQLASSSNPVPMIFWLEKAVEASK